ncbi:hypothetical protein TNIN_62171 [Trichonephila inaurata madagascariensis]|uniref:Uncharacterized protein n=1 Tax=Trichonephila inaurata madagascariensis TaxID=2747483 RepID=A0A8X6WNK4_9ARAC|nr:hypothetical protein TNIN_62171 [Trichonephila inaurata madagascariensis]
MNALCSPRQIAEAVVLWGNRIVGSEIYENFRDVSTSKCLDAILVTVEHFIRAFEDDLDEIINRHCTNYMSEKDFIDFTLPRCMTLSEENHHANFILACAFTARVIFLFYFLFSCFHHTESASKCLSKVLSERFGQVFVSQKLWEGLVKFCKQVNKNAFFVENWVFDEFSGFSSSDDSSENTVLDGIENCSSIEIASSSGLVWAEELGANVPKIKRRCPDLGHPDGLSNERKHSKKYKKKGQGLFLYSLHDSVADSDSPEQSSIESRRSNPKFRDIIINDAEMLSKIHSLIDKCKISIDVEPFLTDYNDCDKENVANLKPETDCARVETAGILIDSSRFCYKCHGKYNKYFGEFSTRYANEYPNLDLVSDIFK